MRRFTREYSVFLVLVQLACIGFVIMTTPLAAFRSHFLLPFELAAVTLLAWAILSMKAQSWNIFPGVRKNAVLAFRGPYKTVRHPMYLSILVFVIPLLFTGYTHARLLAVLLLATVLILKMELEEKMLRARFPGYHNYSRRTYRIIPWIY